MILARVGSRVLKGAESTSFDGFSIKTRMGIGLAPACVYIRIGTSTLLFVDRSCGDSDLESSVDILGEPLVLAAASPRRPARRSKAGRH